MTLKEKERLSLVHVKDVIIRSDPTSATTVEKLLCSTGCCGKLMCGMEDGCTHITTVRTVAGTCFAKSFPVVSPNFAFNYPRETSVIIIIILIFVLDINQIHIKLGNINTLKKCSFIFKTYRDCFTLHYLPPHHFVNA